MNQTSEIASDETILRRISDHPDNTKDRPGRGLTATARALRPRKGELTPSWSRQKITSPERLLELPVAEGIETSGWCVTAVTVAIVRSLGLDVKATPTEEDPGHCDIVRTEQQALTRGVWSRLAKETRIVYDSKKEDR